MRLDWIPASAAAFVTGGMALTFASLMLPTGSTSSDTLRLAREQDGRWLAAAVVFFIASVALTLGLPAALSIFDRKGRALAMLSGVVLAIGFLGTAGYSMLLVFFRALVLNDVIGGRGLDQVTGEAGLSIFLYGWIAAFLLGELMLAVALLRAGNVPRWVSGALLAHLLSALVGSLLPHELASATALLVAIGFAGIAIEAVSRDNLRRSEPVRL